MSAMIYKGYATRIEFDADDHIFVGRLAGIADIVTFHGASAEELEAEFRAAVDHYLAISEQTGIPPQKPYSGELTLHIPPEIHARGAGCRKPWQKLGPVGSRNLGKSLIWMKKPWPSLITALMIAPDYLPN